MPQSADFHGISVRLGTLSVLDSVQVMRSFLPIEYSRICVQLAWAVTLCAVSIMTFPWMLAFGSTSCACSHNGNGTEVEQQPASSCCAAKDSELEERTRTCCQSKTPVVPKSSCCSKTSDLPRTERSTKSGCPCNPEADQCRCGTCKCRSSNETAPPAGPVAPIRNTDSLSFGVALISVSCEVPEGIETDEAKDELSKSILALTAHQKCALLSRFRC